MCSYVIFDIVLKKSHDHLKKHVQGNLTHFLQQNIIIKFYVQESCFKPTLFIYLASFHLC